MPTETPASSKLFKKASDKFFGQFPDKNVPEELLEEMFLAALERDIEFEMPYELAEQRLHLYRNLKYLITELKNL